MEIRRIVVGVVGKMMALMMMTTLENLMRAVMEMKVDCLEGDLSYKR